jgi:hypothetical protein
MTTEQELASAYEKIAQLEAEVKLLRTQLWLAETLSERMSLPAVLDENERLWDALVDTHKERMAAILQHEDPPLQGEVRLRLVDMIR